MGTDDRGAFRPEWGSLIDEIVDDVRRSFGKQIADELGSLLRDRTAEANRALAASFAAAEQRLDDTTSALAEIDERIVEVVAGATSRHQQAAVLHDEAARDRDAAAAARAEADELQHRATVAAAAARAELEQLQMERATLRADLDNLHAPLDAREAELVAWEAELADRAARLADLETGAAPARARTPHHPRDDTGDADAQFRLLRSQWRTPADQQVPATAHRGWGRRNRSDDRTEPEPR